MTFEEKALESIEASNQLYNDKKYNSCVNRAYYGMFQIILHKIDINKQLDAVNYQAKNSKLGTHNFTMKWYIDNILGKRVKINDKILANRCSSTLRDLRHKADYSKESIDEKIAKNAIKYTKDFYNIVKNK
ncbi:HEPN domain-containing protein [Clostridium botulinum]|nr:HEPN domain-containing protein [Clostridium botulinum]NFR15146.1 HEPN domain-containing protein [Clostridium botulinum]NFR44357.1 HEPN domain-containing protein [Clostridium botulinum]NFS49788.1 HEPN domain-containing protein [Clostridium botulinum]